MARHGRTFPIRAHLGKPIVLPVIQGQAAITVADVTLSSTATLVIAGTLARTLDSTTLAATGTLGIAGTLTATLADVTLASTGTLTIAGTLGVTLADVTLVATGTTATTISGVLSVTLADVTVAAVGGSGPSGYPFDPDSTAIPYFPHVAPDLNAQDDEQVLQVASVAVLTLF